MAGRLVAIGLGKVFSNEVASRVPVSKRRVASDAAVRHALEERLQWLAAAEETPVPRQVFVGPPGAGKMRSVTAGPGWEITPWVAQSRKASSGRENGSSV